MENPYHAPSMEQCAAEESRRPLGVAVLSVITGFAGLGLLAILSFLLTDLQKTNAGMAARGLPPPLFWVITSLTTATAFATSVGMWKGRKWGWWIACSGLVHYVIQNFGSAVAAAIATGDASLANLLDIDSLKYVVRGAVMLAILVYWLRTRVRRFYRVEKWNRFLAMLLAGVGGLVIVAIITILTLVLYTLFMYLAR